MVAIHRTVSSINISYQREAGSQGTAPTYHRSGQYKHIEKRLAYKFTSYFHWPSICLLKFKLLKTEIITLKRIMNKNETTLFCINHSVANELLKFSYCSESDLCQHHTAALQTSDQSLGRCNSQRDGMRYIHCSDWVLEHCRMRAKPCLLRGAWRASSALSTAVINIPILWQPWWETQRNNSLWYGRTTVTLQSKCTQRTNRNSYPVNLFRMIFTPSTSSPMVAKALETKFSSI